jgi:hypothetical protein
MRPEEIVLLDEGICSAMVRKEQKLKEIEHGA